MAEKQSNQERLREITASIEDGIKELFQSEQYAQYLMTMSRFHRYSVNNQILIHMQNPNATLVAGFNKWKNQFGRNVIKGQHGIKIIAPTPFKKKIEQEKLDPDTHLPVLDADGRIVTEEKTIQIPMYRPVTVFDVSQTEGRPLPQLAHDLTGNVENYEAFMEALRRSSPVPISFRDMAGMDGYFDLEHQDIALRSGMSEVQTVSAAIHEMAHALLHNRAKEKEAPEPGWKVVMVSEGGTRHDFSAGFATEAEAEQFAEAEGWRFVDENQFEWRLEVEEDLTVVKTAALTRNTEEVQAESISFAVCAYYGIATGENSFGYIASWSQDKTLPELRESLEIINKTAGGLINDIDRHYGEIMKEREAELLSETTVDDAAIAIEPSVQEAPEPPADVPPDPAISAQARNAYGYTDDGMLPLTKERAMEFFERDVPVYLLYGDNTESMAFDQTEILNHDGIFGIDRADWEAVKEQFPIAAENRWQEAFRQNPADSYCIYQLRREDANAEIRFMNMAYLREHGLEPSFDRYDAVYAGQLPAGDTTERLDALYMQFNAEHPADYAGHSLSVSDIVVLRQNGVLSSHYVDSIGFTAVSAFLPENYLKNTEMDMEDDYGMLDGIINNGPKEHPEIKLKSPNLTALFAQASRTVQEDKSERGDGKRQSVLARLHTPTPPKAEKTAQSKSAERDLL